MSASTWHYGVVARWWAEFKDSRPRDRLLPEFVEAGQPALDVACGTGRLLLPYLRAGLDVDGCDVSEDMLALVSRGGRARRPHTDSLRPGDARARPAAPLPDDRRLRWPRPREQPGTGPRGAATPPRTPRAGRRARARQRGALRRRRAVAVLAEGEASRAASAAKACGNAQGREGRRASTSCVRGSSASTLWPSRRRWRCRPSCGETKSWSPRKSTC